MERVLAGLACLHPRVNFRGTSIHGEASCAQMSVSATHHAGAGAAGWEVHCACVGEAESREAAHWLPGARRDEGARA